MGAAILGQLQPHLGDFDVRILSSRPSSEFADAVRQGFTHRQISYSTPAEELIEVLQGTQAIVLALSSQQGDIEATSRRFLSAAVQARVSNVVLSDFSGDLDAEHLEELLVWNGKRAIRQYVRQLQNEMQRASGQHANRQQAFSWASISNGSFLEWALARGFSGFDVVDRRARLVDDGIGTFATTSIATVAEAVVAVLEKFRKPDGQALNRSFQVADAFVTQRQLLAYFEKHTGATWTTTAIDSDVQLADGLALYKSGQIGPGYGKVITSVILGRLERYADVATFRPERVRQDMEDLGIRAKEGIVEQAVADALAAGREAK